MRRCPLPRRLQFRLVETVPGTHKAQCPPRQRAMQDRAPAAPEVVACLRPRTRAVGGGSFHGTPPGRQTSAVAAEITRTVTGQGVLGHQAGQAGGRSRLGHDISCSGRPAVTESPYGTRLSGPYRLRQCGDRRRNRPPGGRLRPLGTPRFVLGVSAGSRRRMWPSTVRASRGRPRRHLGGSFTPRPARAVRPARPSGPLSARPARRCGLAGATGPTTGTHPTRPRRDVRDRGIGRRGGLEPWGVAQGGREC
jgi:hypothetical protein